MLYHVAQQQLSKQSHYDWGLRALTAVLRMAGKLRRDSPGLSEIMVLMRALRYEIITIIAHYRSLLVHIRRLRAHRFVQLFEETKKTHD